MNLTPPMDPNAAPLETLQMRRGILVLLGFAAFICFISAFGFSTFGAMALIFFTIPVLTVVFGLFFQAQSIDIFPTYISINYILRKRLIEHTDIDFVSVEEYTSRQGGVSRKVTYVRLKLRSGGKIDLSGFRDPIQVAYGKLKACESTNEEFLKGR